MVLYYLLTPEYKYYEGKQVRWIRQANVYLTEQQVYDLFYNLATKPDFIGLIYDSDKHILITYWAMSLQWQILLIPLIVGAIAFVGGYLYESSQNSSSSGTGYFSVNNPPGLPNLSFTDILKIGLISLIGGFIAWVGAEIYVSIKKEEHPKNPYTPIIETTQQLYPYAEKTAKGIYSATKEIAKGIYNSINS